MVRLVSDCCRRPWAGGWGCARSRSRSRPRRSCASRRPRTRTSPRHVVDEELAAHIAGQSGHTFTSEADYRDDLQRSRFGITTKREGWDALRHYEIAANGAVPCFRGLAEKPATCAPFGLDETNCIAYRDAEELLERVRGLDDARYAALQQGALAWARSNTTVVRARELLDACAVQWSGPAAP